MPYTTHSNSPLAMTPPPVQMKRVDIPTGDAGTARTLTLMAALARGSDGVQNNQIRQLARSILVNGKVPAMNESAEAHALSQWVNQTIRFTGEHSDQVQEALQSPVATLKMRTGDCDDFAILLSALLWSVGIQNRFQVSKGSAAGDPNAPYSHVFVTAKNKRTGEVLMLDPTLDVNGEQMFSTSQMNSGGAEFGLGQLKPMASFGCPDCGGSCMKHGLGDLSSTLMSVLNSPTLQTLAQGEATNIAYGPRASLTTTSISTAPNPFASGSQIGPSTLTGGVLGAPTIPAWMWIAIIGIGGLVVFTMVKKG